MTRPPIEDVLEHPFELENLAPRLVDAILNTGHYAQDLERQLANAKEALCQAKEDLEVMTGERDLYDEGIKDLEQKNKRLESKLKFYNSLKLLNMDALFLRLQSGEDTPMPDVKCLEDLAREMNRLRAQINKLRTEQGTFTTCKIQIPIGGSLGGMYALPCSVGVHSYIAKIKEELETLRVASCTCQTKAPNPAFHDERCVFRRLSQTMHELGLDLKEEPASL